MQRITQRIPESLITPAYNIPWWINATCRYTCCTATPTTLRVYFHNQFNQV